MSAGARSIVRRRGAQAALAGLLGLVALAPARADVVVAKGAALKPRAAAALADAERAMMICWRGAPPATVRVAVGIEATGLVTASPVTVAAAAQCAAGVLAVWTVPGGPWKGELEIASRIGADDLAGAISRQFADRGQLIRACQAAAPAASGSATIRVKVHPDGDLTDVAVSSKLGARINRCVETAVAGMRLDPLATDAPVTYQLSVAFAGARGAPARGSDQTTAVEAGAAGTPGSVSGALDGIIVQRVLRPAQVRLAGCMKAGAGAGALEVRFTVRAEGTTKNIVIKDATGTVIDQRCVKQVVAGLRFPAASNETRVALPLTMR